MFMVLISGGFPCRFQAGELSPRRAILPSDDVDRLPLLLPERAALTPLSRFTPGLVSPLPGVFCLRNPALEQRARLLEARAVLAGKKHCFGAHAGLLERAPRLRERAIALRARELVGLGEQQEARRFHRREP